MLISLLTPTLNSERYFERTLQSIWEEQGDATGLGIEHIVLDGGSTDRTVDIASRYPSRVVVGKDGGMYEALNKGLHMASGDVWAWVNSDDEVTSGAFRAVRGAFTDHPDARWLVAPTVIIDAAGDDLGVLRPPRWLSADRFRAIGWNVYPQPSTYFRMDFIRALDGLDTRYAVAADYDLFARALQLERPLHLRKPLSRFRLHEANLAKTHGAMEDEAETIALEMPMNRSRRLLLRWLTKVQVNSMSPRWSLGKFIGRVKY